MARSPWIDIPKRSGLERYYQAIEARPGLTVADIWSPDESESKAAAVMVLFDYQKVPWQLPREAYRDTFLKWELESQLGPEVVQSLYQNALYLLDQTAVARIEAMWRSTDQAERNLRPGPDKPRTLPIVMAALLDECDRATREGNTSKNAMFENVAARLGPGIDRAAIRRVFKNKLIPHLHASDSPIFIIAIDFYSRMMAEIDAGQPRNQRRKVCERRRA